MNEKRFEDLLVRPEKIDWKAFKDIADNFLGNYEHHIKFSWWTNFSKHTKR